MYFCVTQIWTRVIDRNTFHLEHKHGVAMSPKWSVGSGKHTGVNEYRCKMGPTHGWIWSNPTLAVLWQLVFDVYCMKTLKGKPSAPLHIHCILYIPIFMCLNWQCHVAKLYLLAVSVLTSRWPKCITSNKTGPITYPPRIFRSPQCFW